MGSLPNIPKHTLQPKEAWIDGTTCHRTEGGQETLVQTSGCGMTNSSPPASSRLHGHLAHTNNTVHLKAERSFN